MTPGFSRSRWVLAVFAVVAVLPAIPPIAAEAAAISDQPLIAAHRGASGYAPENTMAAFLLAERMGADMLELDVRMSRDGELVVIHDETVDRTTPYSGSVANYSLQQLLKMDAGSYYSKRFADQHIPSLDQVLTRFYGRIGLLIELKQPELYPGIEVKVAEAVRRHELLRLLDLLDAGADAGVRSPKIIVQSFNASSLRSLHEWLPDIPVALLISDNQFPLTNALLSRLSAFTSSLHCSYRKLNSATIAKLHRHGQSVMVWTIRRQKDMERMQQLGVDGIITDFPDWRRK